jgi:hypothetical protein
MSFAEKARGNDETYLNQNQIQLVDVCLFFPHARLIGRYLDGRLNDEVSDTCVQDVSIIRSISSSEANRWHLPCCCSIGKAFHRT